MPTDLILNAQALHLWRGERHVLRHVGFTVLAGRCLEVTGANGAGKTSLLRVICGLIYPEEGRVLWNGTDVRGDLSAFQARLGYLGHEPPLKSELSARENLRYWVGMRRHVSAAQIEQVLERVGAAAWSDRPVRTLSAGQRRRAALAGLQLLSVPLWVLDEPATHLDAAGQQLLAALIGEHLAHGGLLVAAVHQPLPLPAHQREQLELAA